MPPYTQIAWHGAMALLMGLLIGVEREHSRVDDEPLFAGVRTFPLIVLTGYLAGLLSQAGFVWVLPVALAGTCAIVVAAYVANLGGAHKGATTEFMALLAFIFGALAALGMLIPAATFAVVTTLLLSTKGPLHQLAQGIREDEIYAVLKFGIVSVIVLPLLPNRTFGPFQVLNPRLIWWMVVLISAVSMIGYLLRVCWERTMAWPSPACWGGLPPARPWRSGCRRRRARPRIPSPKALRWVLLLPPPSCSSASWCWSLWLVPA
jgi:hypothetical protein